MGEKKQGFRTGNRKSYGGRGVHSEITGGKQTGGTGEYGSGIHRS